MKRYNRNELIYAYARHLFDTFGVDCGLNHNSSDLDLNFEDFDACIRNTPEDQLNTEYYRTTIENFVEEFPLIEFEVTLSNSQCIFDNSTFYDFDSAVEFAKGRGDSYNVHINDLSLSCDGLNFDYYNGFDWERITIEQIKDLL